jgi:ATP-dependent Lon protease
MYAKFHSFHSQFNRIGIMFILQHRISLLAVGTHNGMKMAKVKHHEELTMDQLIVNDEMTNLKSEILHSLAKIKSSENKHFDYRCTTFGFWDINYPNFIIDYWAILSSLSLRKYIDTIDINERLKLILIQLKRDLKIIESQDIMKTKMSTLLEKPKLDYLLKENDKLNLILNDKIAANDLLLKSYRERLKDKIIPKDVQNIIDEEMNKLKNSDNDTSDIQITKNYLDWLTILPWGVTSQDRLEIAHAEKVLNDDHYGLEDVKDRILEFIATGRLLGSIPTGKIICLVGPPGTGKTKQQK